MKVRFDLRRQGVVEIFRYCELNPRRAEFAFRACVADRSQFCHWYIRA
jgi:hypothetical protein